VARAKEMAHHPLPDESGRPRQEYPGPDQDRSASSGRRLVGLTARIAPTDSYTGAYFAPRGRRSPLRLTLCDDIHAEIARIRSGF
jgi:hypothetical protein